MVKNNYKIIGTLNYGLKLPKWFFAVLFSVSATVATLTSILLIVDSCSEKFLSADDKIGLLGIISIMLMVLIITLIFALRQLIYFKHTIADYLNDEDLTEITIKPFVTSSEGIGVYKRYKVAVEFYFDNQKEVFFSKKYKKSFKKIIDKEVKTLYSPKYKKLMFLG